MKWRRPRKKLRGLGDAVSLVAQPVATAIDAIAGTSLKTCGGCQRRREWLNGKVPFSPGDDRPG